MRSLVKVNCIWQRTNTLFWANETTNLIMPLKSKIGSYWWEGNSTFNCYQIFSFVLMLVEAKLVQISWEPKQNYQKVFLAIVGGCIELYIFAFLIVNIQLCSLLNFPLTSLWLPHILSPSLFMSVCTKNWLTPTVSSQGNWKVKKKCHSKKWWLEPFPIYLDDYSELHLTQFRLVVRWHFGDNFLGHVKLTEQLIPCQSQYHNMQLSTQNNQYQNYPKDQKQSTDDRSMEGLLHHERNSTQPPLYDLLGTLKHNISPRNTVTLEFVEKARIWDG